jgi:U3 small nucleolar RNA-associated protein 25
VRQSILFSSQVSPEQNALFRTLDNLSGKAIHFHHTDRNSAGILWKVRRGLQQTWLALDGGAEPALDDDERRLQSFNKHILQPLQLSALVKEGLGGVLIFVPSYFDFVRLENLFRSIDDIKFAAISECVPISSLYP